MTQPDLPETQKQLADRIDHTNLSPDAKKQDIKKTLREAKIYKFRSVCLPPYWVPLAEDTLKDTEVILDTVIGFPLGFTSLEGKLAEAKWAIEHGAEELDMVMNITAYKSKRKEVVRREIANMLDLGVTTKVIIGTPFLTPKEIKEVSELMIEEGTDYVKTCTGFEPRGVTERDVRLIREAIGTKGKIKAAGGIRNANAAIKMMQAGANIIGASHGVEILETFNRE